MEMDEFVKEKEHLEVTIFNLLCDFQKKTGYLPQSIEMDTTTRHSVGGLEHKELLQDLKLIIVI